MNDEQKTFYKMKKGTRKEVNLKMLRAERYTGKNYIKLQ